MLYVISKKTSSSAFSDFKCEPIAECFKCDKAGAATFLNDYKREPLNMLNREESLKINVF